MNRRLRRLVAAAMGAEWAIIPEKLHAIIDVLAFQAEGGNLSPAEIRARVGDGKAPPATGAGIAVLPLYGVVGHRMNQVNDISGPGGTSTEQFGSWFDAAMADPAIGAIVIDIDSPGGTVQGTPELARKIYQARGDKPIVAIANSMAASAAYWIACAADEVWVIPSGDVGSIGVYAIHEDQSAADAEAGLKYTIISAGKYKVEGHGHAPLGDEALAAMQERINGFGADFTHAIATYRGVKVGDVANGFGEGRIVRAKPALAAGMVDKIGTMDELLARLGGSRGSKSRARAEATPLQLVAAVFNDTITHTHIDPAAVAAAALTQRADVAAAPVVVPVHAEPAPAAKEHKVNEEEKAAALAAEKAAAAAVAETTRRDALLALVEEYGQPIARARTWIKDGASLEAAQGQILAELKAAHKSKPVARIDVSVLDSPEHGKTGPYRTLGQNLQDIARAGQTGQVSTHLAALQEMAAVSSGGASATVGTDGGFLIQKEFAVDLLESTFKTGDILSRVDTTEVGPNADGLEVVYLDETSRATGSRWGGVQVYRGAEADSATAKKPKTGKWECRLEDIIGAAYMTERLLQDAPAMADVFAKGFAEEFTFVTENEIFRGSGVGQMLGVLTAIYSATAGSSFGPTVSVAKETGQAADTIQAENIQKMWTRVHPRSRAKGAWFINVECEPQLDNMMIGTGTSGQLVYMPAGGLSGASYGSLKGRPVIPVEYAAGLGDVGDIMFADFSRYKVITKGGLQSDDSIHVRFLNNERTFRWLTRINGSPKDKAAITPFKATDTALRLSPFIVLAAR